MIQNPRISRLRQMARRRHQTGELSIVEAAAVLAGAALLGLLAVVGSHFVMDRIHASQFKTEANMFHSGILDATANDTDYSTETLATLALNHAFDEAGSRVSTSAGTVTGLFGGTVSAAPGTISTTDDSEVLSYPIPNTVCSLSAATLANTFSEVTVNGTTVFGPTTPFSSATSASACDSAGATATVEMYTSKN